MFQAGRTAGQRVSHEKTGGTSLCMEHGRVESVRMSRGALECGSVRKVFGFLIFQKVEG